MKKKGFTLIELLAVIVILAIIALIATPIVMNVIKNTKKGAVERSAENYLRAVETAIAEERMDGPIENGTYFINKDGNLELISNHSIIIIVNVNGAHTFNGTIEIENGNIIKITNFEVDSVTLIVSGNNIEALDDVYDKYVDVVESEEIADGTYYIQEDGSLCSNANGCSVGTEISFDLEGTIPTSGTVKIVDGKIVKSESNIIIGDYTIVYYNETTGSVQTSTKTCMLVEDLNNDGLGYGDKYVCNSGNNELKTFYMLENNEESGKISLILSANIDSEKVDYRGNLASTQAFINDALVAKTSSWTNEKIEGITLPSAEQILAASNITGWNASIYACYNKQGKVASWLYDSNNIEEYWTSNPGDSGYMSIQSFWTVGRFGYLCNASNVATDQVGIRPVIIIPTGELG